jgi:hypothetical protein
VLRSVPGSSEAVELSVRCRFDQGREGGEAGVAAFQKFKETSCGPSSTNNLFNVR